MTTRTQNQDNERASKALRLLNEARPGGRLTHQEIADASGIPVDTVNKIMRNRAPIRIGQFTAIAEALGFDGTEAMATFMKVTL